jgi:hypothetical protein
MVLLLAAVALLAGCRTVPQTDGDQSQPSDPKPLLPYIQSNADSDKPQPIDGAHLLPLREGSWIYQIVAGENDGENFTQRIEKADDDTEAPWRRHVGDSQIEHLRVEEDGSIVMPAIEDLEHNVITRFDPALPVMLAHQPPGETHTTESSLTVVNRDNPDQTVNTGQSTLEWTHDADRRIDVPAGEYDVRRVRVTYKANFPAASIESVTIVYYAVEVGPVASHYEENGSALIVPWSKQRTIILESVAKKD